MLRAGLIDIDDALARLGGFKYHLPNTARDLDALRRLACSSQPSNAAPADLVVATRAAEAMVAANVDAKSDSESQDADSSTTGVKHDDEARWGSDGRHGEGVYGLGAGSDNLYTMLCNVRDSHVFECWNLSAAAAGVVIAVVVVIADETHDIAAKLTF